MKKVFLLLVFISFSWGQDYFGILGFREFKITEDCTVCDIAPYFDTEDYTDSYLKSITSDESSIIIGAGYKKYKYYLSNQIFNSYFINREIYSMDFISGEPGSSYDEDDYWSWGHWTIGTGYGIVNKDGLTLSGNVEYNFTGIDVISDYESFGLTIPKKNYLSFNISLGVSWGVNKSIWSTPIGIHYSKPINKYYINPNFSQMQANDIILEMPATWLTIGAAIVGVAAAVAATPDLPTSSSSTASGNKGCHVYGNIKFVEFGEDYKVKFVESGQDLNIKYVSISASSSGQWKVVDFGEDYKIKVVQFGEDFKVKEVVFGEGC
jgi:hypothetical protein